LNLDLNDFEITSFDCNWIPEGYVTCQVRVVFPDYIWEGKVLKVQCKVPLCGDFYMYLRDNGGLIFVSFQSQRFCTFVVLLCFHYVSDFEIMNASVGLPEWHLCIIQTRHVVSYIIQLLLRKTCLRVVTHSVDSKKWQIEEMSVTRFKMKPWLVWYLNYRHNTFDTGSVQGPWLVTCEARFPSRNLEMLHLFELTLYSICYFYLDIFTRKVLSWIRRKYKKKESTIFEFIMEKRGFTL